jgi:hypothetical protein
LSGGPTQKERSRKKKEVNIRNMKKRLEKAIKNAPSNTRSIPHRLSFLNASTFSFFP